uniref:Putative secreted peptide n=1 Tax=Anopheles braziliensis TaxID=58242 RepID=A0A2M3ZU99_9DIPT
MLHNFLLQLLLLAIQVVHFVGEVFLFVMVMLLVLQRVRQQLLVLGQYLRNVIHQCAPIDVQAGVHVQQHFASLVYFGVLDLEITDLFLLVGQLTGKLGVA